MKRNKSSEILTDKELERDDKNRDHLRKQSTKDTIASVTNTAIIVLPMIVVIWIFLMGIHYILTNNWDSFNSAGQSLLIYVGGYITRYVQSLGMKND